jgi:hypothetical protein
MENTAQGATRPSAAPATGFSDQAPPPPPSCKSGETYYPFTVVGLDEIPETRPQEASEGRIFTRVPELDATEQLRLDLCINDRNEAVLTQIVQKARPPFVRRYYTWFTPGASSIIRGLDDAISGDPSNLYVLVPTDDRGNAFLLRGVSNGTQSYVYYADGQGTSPETVKAYIFVFGNLLNEDPFAGENKGPCPGRKFAKTTTVFELPERKVTIELLSCDTDEFSTVRQDWQSVKILDSAAPGAYANQEFHAKRGEEPADFDYKYFTTHHNACTEYSIQLPYATYAYTIKSAPGNLGANVQTCGGFLAGTPTARGKFALRITEKGKPPVDFDDPKTTVTREAMGDAPNDARSP